MLHRAPAHWTMPLQLEMPLHVMSHLVAAAQSTPSAQLPALAQVTRQGSPAGHTTRELHGRDSSHRMTHSPAAHVPIPFASHSLAQTSAARPSASGTDVASRGASAADGASSGHPASTVGCASDASASVAS
jgi:hypothetical protein